MLTIFIKGILPCYRKWNLKFCSIDIKLTSCHLTRSCDAFVKWLPSSLPLFRVSQSMSFTSTNFWIGCVRHRYKWNTSGECQASLKCYWPNFIKSLVEYKFWRNASHLIYFIWSFIRLTSMPAPNWVFQESVDVVSVQIIKVFSWLGHLLALDCNKFFVHTFKRIYSITHLGYYTLACFYHILTIDFKHWLATTTFPRLSGSVLTIFVWS